MSSLLSTEFTPDDAEKAKKLLILDEGYRTKVYQDTVGKETIGVGRNLVDKGLSHKEVDMLLDNDVNEAIKFLRKTFDFFKDLSPARKYILINMYHNLGGRGLLSFRKMISHLEQRDYILASKELMDSRAARMLERRYERLRQMMVTGKFT